MAEIKLKAILRAYSKSPFYNDFVRDIYSQKEVLPETQYVRIYKETIDENGDPNNIGEWVPLNTSLLEKPLEEYAQQVASLKEGVNKISVKVDEKTNQLIFTDSQGKVYYDTLPQAKVDGTTIKIDDEYRSYVIDTPDNETLKITNIVYRNGVDENGVPIPDPNTGIIDKISGKIRVEGIYINDINTVMSGNELNSRLLKAEKNIKDLEEYTQGTGGFLDPYNFGKALNHLSQEEKNTLLNKEAYNQLSNGIAQLIPDQTKIKNLFDGHIWVYVQKDNNWLDEGADTIVTANNEGILGAVTGVEYNPNDISTKFKISIGKDGLGNSNGIMSVNGLAEEFGKVIYKTDGDENNAGAGTYVKRTSMGTIVANPSINDNDVVTQGQINEWFSEFRLPDDMINQIVNMNYEPVINNGRVN